MPHARKMLPQMTAVGLLGSGQLARMLILAAHPMGLKSYVLTENADDPAAQVTAHAIQGKTQNSKDIIAFLEKLELASFESEFVDVDQLMQIPARLQQKFFPSLFCMKLLQNRKTQKQSLVDFKLPTADFVAVENLEGLNKAVEKLGLPLVLKKAFGGYDGYGTYYVRNSKDFKKFTQTQLASTKESQSSWIAEKFIPFRRELAITVARNRQGQMAFLPLVETKQTNSRCDWVCGPTKHTGLAALQKKLKKYLTAINYVGVISFELFDTGKNLIINEVAPRVHNSAHYSMNALSLDQFTLHWYCGLGLELPKIEVVKPFAMANILGDTNSNIEWSSSGSGHMHLYGKIQNRPGRKMGHINVLASSSKLALKQALQFRKGVKK